MAAKRFLFGQEGRARLLEGSRILAGAVKPTLGPGGRTIMLERPMHRAPLVTKDGVTVAERGRAGGVVREHGRAAGARERGEDRQHGRRRHHDGHRARARHLSRGDASWWRRDITRSRSSAASTSASSASSGRWRRCRGCVKGKRDIAQVATVSANGDTAIGKLIADAVDKVGLEGIIHVEQGAELETKLEVGGRGRDRSRLLVGLLRHRHGAAGRAARRRLHPASARTRSAPSPSCCRSSRRSPRPGARCWWWPRSPGRRCRCWSSTSCKGR